VCSHPHPQNHPAIIMRNANFQYLDFDHQMEKARRSENLGLEAELLVKRISVLGYRAEDGHHLGQILYQYSQLCARLDRIDKMIELFRTERWDILAKLGIRAKHPRIMALKKVEASH
jgi:hypothetical protein